MERSRYGLPGGSGRWHGVGMSDDASPAPPSSQWMTYAAAAERLGVSPDAVAARARRRKWPKRKNPARNDGLAEVLVPAEDLAQAAPTVGATPPPTPPAAVAPDAAIIALQAALSALRAALERTDGDRRILQQQADALREQLSAVQVERAQAVGAANAEKARVALLEQRLAELRRDVEDWRQRAKRRWWRIFG